MTVQANSCLEGRRPQDGESVIVSLSVALDFSYSFVLHEQVLPN